MATTDALTESSPVLFRIEVQLPDALEADAVGMLFYRESEQRRELFELLERTVRNEWPDARVQISVGTGSIVVAILVWAGTSIAWDATRWMGGRLVSAVRDWLFSRFRLDRFPDQFVISQQVFVLAAPPAQAVVRGLRPRYVSTHFAEIMGLSAQAGLIVALIWLLTTRA